MRIFLPLIILISIQSKAFGQIDFTELVISDSIYLDYIRTIEFRNTQNELSLPVLDIKSGTLICEFDDSYGDFIDYHYTIVHCDKEWNITEDVEVSEYLEGQDNISIEDYQSSVNTIMKYNHYSFSFPNDDLSFIWSGNYLLVVYDDEGTIAFTKKFYVIDNQTVINPSSVSPMVDGVYDTHQAFMVDLDLERLDPMNPIDEVYVTVFQNRFNERLMPFRQAVRMDNNTAIFNSIDQFLFPGFKEFRFFDTRNVLTAGENVQNIDISDEQIFVLLELDKRRDVKPYIYRKEINGGFVLRNSDRSFGEKDVTSEYANVLFTLKYPIEAQGDVYVLGPFNDFKMKEDFKMDYLNEYGAYNLEVPLKQGFYNYQYALKNKDGSLDYYTFEGNSFETENEYHFLVYYRPLSGEYDQLVGYKLYHHNQR